MSTNTFDPDAGKVWCVGRDEEHFTGETFDTKREAIDAGPGELDLEPGDTFYVGERREFAPVITGSTLIDHLQDRAYDEVGEHSDGWLSGVTNDQAAELDEEINAVIERWIARHGHTPRFFAVDRIEAHTVPEDPTR